MISHNIKEGMITEFKKVTCSSDAYWAPGTMTLDFLVSTPAVISMIIEASAEMLDELVPADFITIGSHIELSHDHATLIGEEVTIRIKVAKIVNNTIYLEIEGRDSDGVFCSGNYERHIVNKLRLMESAYKRFNKTKK